MAAAGTKQVATATATATAIVVAPYDATVTSKQIYKHLYSMCLQNIRVCI